MLSPGKAYLQSSCTVDVLISLSVQSTYDDARGLDALLAYDTQPFLITSKHRHLKQYRLNQFRVLLVHYEHSLGL